MKTIGIKRLAMATALLLAVNMNANAQSGEVWQQQAANAQVDLARQRDVEKKLAELRQERAANEKAAQDQAGQTGNLPLADEKNGDVTLNSSTLTVDVWASIIPRQKPLTSSNETHLLING